MGNWHAWHNLFLRSRVADVGIANLMAFSVVNNTSVGSRCFLDFDTGHTWDSPTSITGNRVLDPTGEGAMKLSNAGPYLVVDNTFRCRGETRGSATGGTSAHGSIYRVLNPRGIRLMLYLPCQVPNRDARAQKAFGLAQDAQDQPIDVTFAEKWAKVIHDWSARYADKVAGWWFDGGYQHIGFNESIARTYAQAVKHGNPQAIVTFNPGVKLIRWTEAEDYTAGELNEPLNHLPTDRWVEGSQWHALTYLGSRWSARDTRYPTEHWTRWVKSVVAKKGVVTLDAGPNWNPTPGPIGSISDAQMAQLKAIGRAIQPKTTPDVYVSPHGNDTWSGRLAAPNADGSDGPLASVGAAQGRVRQIRQAQPNRTKPVHVALRGGTYTLDEPLAVWARGFRHGSVPGDLPSLCP